MLDRVLNPATDAPIFGRSDNSPVGWAVSTAPVGYPQAVAAMEARAAAMPDPRQAALKRKIAEIRARDIPRTQRSA